MCPLAGDLFRLAFWRLGDKHDAEDIVQEAYLRAFRSFDSFEIGSNAKAWMTRIVLNVINDSFKRKARQLDSVALEDECDQLEKLQSNSASARDPEIQLIEKEVDQKLLQALQRLPTILLHPLLLRELQDMTYADIANAMEIPVGTVMSRLFKARRLMREALTRADQNPMGLGVVHDEMR